MLILQEFPEQFEYIPSIEQVAPSLQSLHPAGKFNILWQIIGSSVD